MNKKNFIDTFSDDLLCVEEAYRIYLKQNLEIDWIIWPSLCRIYTLTAVSSVDFFINYILEKAKVNSKRDFKKDIESIVKTALKTENIPNELDIPKKIQKYICLRELRNYLVHSSLNKDRELKIKSISLHLDVDKFTEAEFDIIKRIVKDIINLVGMSLVLIDNSELRKNI